MNDNCLLIKWCKTKLELGSLMAVIYIPLRNLQLLNKLVVYLNKISSHLATTMALLHTICKIAESIFTDISYRLSQPGKETTPIITCGLKLLIHFQTFSHKCGNARLYWVCDYLSMLGLTSICIAKNGSWHLIQIPSIWTATCMVMLVKLFCLFLRASVSDTFSCNIRTDKIIQNNWADIMYSWDIF